MIEYEVACELHYAVHGPAEFVFNLHAARNSHQQVLKETFQIDGATSWSGHDDPDLGNRLARATAPKGALRVRFESATSNASTSAPDTIVQSAGVCRDFAHLTISLLRALNIPARLVTGYDYGVPASYGPTDFHAYVEAWLGGRWWIFDATRLCPRTGLVRIGTGHDAVDTAFATIFGPAKYERMRVDIKPHAADGQSVMVEDDRTLALSPAGLEDNLRWGEPRGGNAPLSSAA